MNKYKVGLYGELISEGSLSRLLEQDGITLNLEAAKKRAGSVTTAPTTTSKATSTKATSTGEKSEKEKFISILNRGDARALEYVIYATAMTPLMHLFYSNYISYGDKWSDLEATKKYFPNLEHTGKNPLQEFNSYWYWYDATIEKIFGSTSFKDNIINQDGWYYQNVWLGMMKALNQITYYQNQKDHPGITQIFENVYSAGQTLISNFYDSPSEYKIEIPCFHRLLKYPDEFSVYIEHAKATRNNLKYPDITTQTVVEQLQKVKASLVGVFEVDEKWRSYIDASKYIGEVTHPASKTIKNTFPLKLR
jgi:hypothetical protein